MRKDSLKLFLILFLLACSTDNPKDKESKKIFYIKATCKGNILYLEVAETPEEIKKGLMFRESLPESTGMLFVFPGEDYLSFWMRNTYIPLSIAFLDSQGIIVDIQKMRPLDEKPHTSRKKASLAIETNEGWFQHHHIEIGDTFKIPGYTLIQN
ncbi:MAG: DUF192 domain-containing protein [Candidatus Hydrothermae bacterium]|nr:DUF192 domain-containing protein [Candidatus Hydrothermae bacterium]